MKHEIRAFFAAVAIAAGSLSAPHATAAEFFVLLGGRVVEQTGSFEGRGSILGKYVGGAIALNTDTLATQAGASHVVMPSSETFSAVDQPFTSDAIHPYLFYRDGEGSGLSHGFFAKNASATFGTGALSIQTDWTQLNTDGSAYARYQFDLTALVPDLAGRVGHLRLAPATATDRLSTFTYTNFLRPEHSYSFSFAPAQFDIIDVALPDDRLPLFPEHPIGAPEPATWAMLIFGFGFMGQMLRRRAACQGHLDTRRNTNWELPMSMVGNLAVFLAASSVATTAFAQGGFATTAISGGIEVRGPFAFSGHGIDGFADDPISIAFNQDYDVSLKSSSPLEFTVIRGTYYEHFHTYLDGVEIDGNDQRLPFFVELTPSADRTFWSGQIFGAPTRRIAYEYYTDDAGVQHELMTMRWYDKNVWLAGGLLYEPDLDGGWRFTLTAAPEPSTWAMMILGFSAAGAALRRRRMEA